MGSRRNTAALLAAVIGLAMVIVESANTLGSHILGTVGTIVLWAGLAIFVAACAVLITEQPSEPTAGGGETSAEEVSS